MFPLQPRSTLFPYTTLFRSRAERKHPRPPIEITAEKDPSALDKLIEMPSPMASLFADVREALHDLLQTAKRSEEHTSELQSRGHLVCRLLLEKKKEQNKALI